MFYFSFKINTIALIALLGFSSTMALVQKNDLSLLSQKRVLVIDGTHGSHSSTREAMTVKLNQLKNVVGFEMTQVTNPPSNLINFDIIVFNYWFDNQNSAFGSFHAAFQNWIRSGNKGWIGYHTSGANENNEWNWLRDSVTSMRYIAHSVGIQTGEAIRTTNAIILDEPIMEGLPSSFTGQDEWYEYEFSAPTFPDVKIMYYLDESTLPTPLKNPMDPHPMAWYREAMNGTRFFFTPMIHTVSGVNSVQGNNFFPSMILRALEWVAGYDVVLDVKEIQKSQIHFRLLSNSLVVNSNQEFNIAVHATDGKLVASKQGTGHMVYNLSGAFNPGVYFVSVKTATKEIIKKLVVD